VDGRGEEVLKGDNLWSPLALDRVDQVLDSPEPRLVGTGT